MDAPSLPLKKEKEKMKVYRIISKKEYDSICKGNTIECSHINTQKYAKGKKGVFFFPKRPNKDARIRNGFFVPWLQGKNTMIVICNIPCSRIIAHGKGRYDGCYMPELLINEYSKEDVVCAFPVSELHRVCYIYDSIGGEVEYTY